LTASAAGALWPYFDEIAHFDSALLIQNLPQRILPFSSGSGSINETFEKKVIE